MRLSMRVLEVWVQEGSWGDENRKERAHARTEDRTGKVLRRATGPPARA